MFPAAVFSDFMHVPHTLEFSYQNKYSISICQPDYCQYSYLNMQTFHFDELFSARLVKFELALLPKQHYKCKFSALTSLTETILVNMQF